jgi:hypothetical protein
LRFFLNVPLFRLKLPILLLIAFTAHEIFAS